MARTLAEIDALIASGETKLQAGVQSVQFADRMTSINLKAIQEEIDRLRDERARVAAAAAGRRRQHLGYGTKGF